LPLLAEDLEAGIMLEATPLDAPLLIDLLAIKINLVINKNQYNKKEYNKI
jgi:hypothetical protein